MKQLHIKQKTMESFGSSHNILCLGIWNNEKSYWEDSHALIVDEYSSSPLAYYISDFINEYDCDTHIVVDSRTESYDCDCCGSYYDDVYTFKCGDITLESGLDGHFGNHWNMYLEDEVIEFFKSIGYEINIKTNDKKE